MAFNCYSEAREDFLPFWTLHSASTLPSKPHNQQQKIDANCTLTLLLSTIYSAVNQKQQLNSSPSIPTVNTTNKIAQLHTITPPSKLNPPLRLSHSTNNKQHQQSVNQRLHFLPPPFIHSYSSHRTSIPSSPHFS